MYDRLSTLLAPLLPDDFFQSFRKREYLYIGRGIPGFFDRVLGVEDLDAYFASCLLPASAFNIVVRNGVRVPLEEWSRPRTLATGIDAFAIPERVFELYRGGATIILNASGEAISTLATACRELARELEYRVQANVYITPSQAQGFVRHSDNHDVLVLQISGRKTWSVYASPEAPGCTGAVELDLNPGDLLYIPHGMDHEARCSDLSSIHVTLGLLPVYGYQLVEELATLARDHPWFRAPAPSRIESGEEHRDFGLEFARQVRLLLEEAQPANLLDRRFQAFVNSQPNGWRGRFRDVLGLQGITAETVLCSRKEISRYVAQIGNSLEVHFAGRVVTVPGFLRSALQRILDDSPFVVRDLPGMMTPSGRVDLVKPLVSNGLVSIVHN